jgi:1-acyl-sn-glycerol-3-phosphate acyltransferase
MSVRTSPRRGASAEGSRGEGSRPRAYRDDIDWFVAAVAWFARFALRAFAHVRVAGLENVPRTGPLIVAANHASNVDGVLLGGWLTPALGRRIHWLGKKEMTEWPVIGPMARFGSIHPVDRARGDAAAFRLAEDLLADGQVLVVFPEGTRSPNGELQRPKDGLALLALRSGAPILPVGVVDTDRFWPKGRRIWYLGRTVRMRIGEPFVLAEALGPELMADRRAAKRAATDAIMTRIAALLPERQRGAYAPDVRPRSRIGG